MINKNEYRKTYIYAWRQWGKAVRNLIRVMRKELKRLEMFKKIFGKLDNK